MLVLCTLSACSWLHLSGLELPPVGSDIRLTYDNGDMILELVGTVMETAYPHLIHIKDANYSWHIPRTKIEWWEPREALDNNNEQLGLL